MLKNNVEIDLDINLYRSKLQQLGLFFQDLENGHSYPNYIWKELGYSPEEMSNLGFLDYIHPDDRDNVESTLKSFLNNKKDMSRVLFRIKNKKGHWRWILSTTLSVEYNNDGVVSKYIGYDDDVTEHIKTVRQVEKALKEAEIFRSVGEAITSHLSLEDTIKAVLEQAERVIDFQSSSVQLLKDEHMEIVGETGFTEKSMVGKTFKLTENIPNDRIIRERRSLIVKENLTRDYPGFRDLSGSVIKSWLGVPLICKDRIIGIMTFDQPMENGFNEEDQRLAESFAHQVAIALENSILYERTKELSIRDPLTGCYSRRHLFESLARECDSAERYGSKLSLIMFDIDDFKVINDTYGHLIGDSVLKKIVHLANCALRKTDILCRYGGEEFAVILPSSDLDQALTASERIRTSIKRSLNDPDIPRMITVSLGCTELGKFDQSCPEKLIARADKALYQSKQKGKDCTSSL